MSKLVTDDDRHPLLVGRGTLPGVVQQVRFPVTRKKQTTMENSIVLPKKQLIIYEKVPRYSKTNWAL